MALNIRKTKFDDSDVIRMLRDVLDFGAIPENVRTQMWSSSKAMNVIANDQSIIGRIANSEMVMNEIANIEIAMNAIANSSTAMNVVGGSYIAMNAIMSGSQVEKWWGSSYYVGKGLATYANLSHADFDPLNTVSDIANNSAAMNAIWGVDRARQACWGSSAARLAIYNNISVLQSITVDSTPNLISETPLNTDATAGYLTYLSKNKGEADWTAVNINDGNKYIAFIHFHSYYDDDWYSGKIASYDQTTDLQTTTGGNNLTRGNCQATSNGLWVFFHTNVTNNYSSTSYARVWYIKV